MEREEILKIASEHFTALYITWNEPTGKPDWSLIKDKLSCPASEEQLIAFAKAIAAHEREECAKIAAAETKELLKGGITNFPAAIRARGNK